MPLENPITFPYFLLKEREKKEQRYLVCEREREREREREHKHAGTSTPFDWIYRPIDHGVRDSIYACRHVHTI